MAPRETENNAYAKFGVTNKEHYGMLWYFLEWSIQIELNRVKNSIWVEANQLAIYKHGRGFELRTTVNKSS